MAGFLLTSEDVIVTVKNKKLIYSWLERVIQSEGKSAGKITMILCSDDFLHKMNKEYLDHDYYTDIITFDYSERGVVSGELYISYDRVKENAKTFSVATERELYRVLVHGVLHLCGYKDKTDAQARIMRSKEDEKLALKQN